MLTEDEAKVATADLKRVLKLVAAATVSSRELDAEIAYILVPDFARAGRQYYSGSAFRWKMDGPKMRAQIIRDHFSEHGRASRTLPPYTSSLESIIALADRVLPGWGYHFRKDSEGAEYWGCHASFLYPKYNLVTAGSRSAPTVPLAVAAAMLVALIAKAEHVAA